MSTLIAIDPGASGAVAIWLPEQPVHVVKMPTTRRDLWEFFSEWKSAADMGGGLVAVLEEVHTMPTDGVASAGKFMRHFGNLEMSLIAAGIPIERVPPHVWQRQIGVKPRMRANKKKGIKGESKTVHKNRLKARAQELFPHLKVTLATCDALLIGWWWLQRQRREVTA